MNQAQNATTVLSTSPNDRMWAMLCHLGTLATFFPFANVILPLLIWSMKKEDSPFINDQGKEALNFQITIMIGYAICIPLFFLFIGIPLIAALGIYHIVFSIVAAIKSNEGLAYRYPFALRLIS